MRSKVTKMYTTVEWTSPHGGPTHLVLGELRSFVEECKGLPDEASVSVMYFTLGSGDDRKKFVASHEETLERKVED